MFFTLLILANIRNTIEQIIADGDGVSIPLELSLYCGKELKAIKCENPIIDAQGSAKCNDDRVEDIDVSKQCILYLVKYLSEMNQKLKNTAPTALPVAERCPVTTKPEVAISSVISELLGRNIMGNEVTLQRVRNGVCTAASCMINCVPSLLVLSWLSRIVWVIAFFAIRAPLWVLFLSFGAKNANKLTNICFIQLSYYSGALLMLQTAENFLDETPENFFDGGLEHLEKLKTELRQSKPFHNY